MPTPHRTPRPGSCGSAGSSAGRGAASAALAAAGTGLAFRQLRRGGRKRSLKVSWLRAEGEVEQVVTPWEVEAGEDGVDYVTCPKKAF